MSYLNSLKINSCSCLCLLILLINHSLIAQTSNLEALEQLHEKYKNTSSDSAVKYALKRYKAAKKENNHSAIAASATTIFDSYKYKGLNDEAYVYAQEAIKSGTIIQDNFLIANAYKGIAMIYSNQSNYVASVENYLLAETYFNKLDEVTNDEIYGLTRLSYILSNLGNFEQAEKKLITAQEKVKGYKKKDSLRLKTNINESYGWMYLNQKNYVKAKSYFERCLATGKILNRKSSSSKNNIGLCYYGLKQYDLAETYLLKAHEIMKNGNDMLLNLTENSLFLGKTYHAKKEYEKALQVLTFAEANALKIESSDFFVQIQLELAKIYLARNNVEKAIQKLEQTLDMPISDLSKFKASGYELLTSLYVKTNNKRKALASLKNYIEISDKEFKDSRLKQIEVLNISNNYERARDSLSAKQKELKLLFENQEIKNKNNLLYIVILSILLISLVGFYFRQRKLARIRKKYIETKEKQIATEAAFKNKQITDFAVYIEQRNQILNTIKKIIKTIKSSNSEERTKVNEVVNFINDTMNQKKEEVSLYKDINHNNEAFLSKLSSEYPDLKEQEKRIAILIRLNFNTKQIAAQMGISPSSVDNYRYNIRKKMNLDKEVNLKTFIKRL